MPFQTKGAAFASAAAGTTIAVTAPAIPDTTNRWLIIRFYKGVLGNAIGAPVGWTQVYQGEVNVTSGRDHRVAIFAKAAAPGDSGAIFNFTQTNDFAVVFTPGIEVWSGVTGIDATASGALSSEATVDGTTVDFPAFDPTGASVEVHYSAFVAQQGPAAVNMTVAPAELPAGSDLAYTPEGTTEGTDCTIGVASLAHDGTSVPAATWTIVPTVTNSNTGVVFAMTLADEGGGGTPVEITLPSAVVYQYAVGSGIGVEVEGDAETEPPIAVADLAAEGLSGGRIRLSWSTVPDAIGYRVYRGDATGVTSATGVLVDDVAAGPLDDTGLNVGEDYFYVVVAYNGAGDAEDSNEATATPPAPSAATPGRSRPGIGFSIGF